MKDFFVSLALIAAIFVSTQVSYAACWNNSQVLNPMTYISYLNPLPYFGIGENRTNFSLNPFTGFKNCDTCRVKRVAINTCGCNKVMPKCNTCHREYVEPIVVPKCSSCGGGR